MTAENVADRCKVTREQQDEWAVISQNRAVEARDSGHFDAEIVPVPVPAHKDVDKEGNEIDVPDTVVTRTTGRGRARRSRCSSQLKPAFKPDGTVTAGNACPLNDGAAAVLVMSDEKAKQLGLKPKARIIASTVAAIRPEIMGLGPIPAIQALLKQTGMKIDDVDIVEINEAFAAQIVPVQGGARDPRREAQPVRRRDRARPPVRDDRRADHDHAAQRPERVDGTYGIESMCVAGGMGQAMLIERLH